jgi:hypothetical protein
MDITFFMFGTSEHLPNNIQYTVGLHDWIEIFMQFSSDLCRTNYDAMNISLENTPLN